MIRRLVDLLLALIGLVLTAPASLIAALAVRWSSPGPVLHRAVRVGLHGETFSLLKFRTMRVADDDRGGITSAGDPRITRVGRVLRRTKVDELPQLWNVVRGDMSIVGPRPEDPRYVAGYTEEQRRVLSVRPGLTSPASVAYRDEERIIAARGGDPVEVYRTEILPAKLALDLGYLARRTLLTDLVVIWRTALSLIRSR